MSLYEYLQLYAPQILSNVSSDVLIAGERDEFLSECHARELDPSAGPLREQAWIALEELTHGRRLRGPTHSPGVGNNCIRKDRLVSDIAFQDALEGVAVEDRLSGVADDIDTWLRSTGGGADFLERLRAVYGSIRFGRRSSTSTTNPIVWMFQGDVAEWTKDQIARVPCKLGLYVTRVESWFVFRLDTSSSWHQPTFFDSGGFELWRPGGRTLIVCEDTEVDELGFEEFVSAAPTLDQATGHWEVAAPTLTK